MKISKENSSSKSLSNVKFMGALRFALKKQFAPISEIREGHFITNLKVRLLRKENMGHEVQICQKISMESCPFKLTQKSYVRKPGFLGTYHDF